MEGFFYDFFQSEEINRVPGILFNGCLGRVTGAVKSVAPGVLFFRKNSKVCCIQILPAARSAIRVKGFPRGSEKFRAKNLEG